MYEQLDLQLGKVSGKQSATRTRTAHVINPIGAC